MNTTEQLTKIEESINNVSISISKTKGQIRAKINELRLANLCSNFATNEDQRKYFTGRSGSFNKELSKLYGQLSTFEYGFKELTNKKSKQLN